MREILFRAKTSDEVRGFKFAPNGTWVYGFYMDKVGLPVVYQFEQSRSDYVDYEVDRATVGQFIGLTDRSNRQIFEGDILKLTDKNNNYEWTAVVEFGNPNSYYTWGWQLKPITKNVEYNLDILCWVDIDDFGVYCEVIGNIYDNPELLGGAK